MNLNSAGVAAAYELFNQHQKLVAKRARIDAEIAFLEKQMAQVVIEASPAPSSLPAPAPGPTAPKSVEDPPLPVALSDVGNRANAQALIIRAIKKNNLLDYGALTAAIYDEDGAKNRRRLTQRLRYMASINLIRNVRYRVWEIVGDDD